MNNIFKKQSVLVLDSEYRLESDRFNGVVLIRKFMAEKINPKTKEARVVEDEDSRYFPRVAQALEYYLNRKQNSDLTLQAIVYNTEKVAEVIERFDKEFKQYG